MRRWVLVVGLMGVIAACADGTSDDTTADSTVLPSTTAVATTGPTTSATAAGASAEVPSGWVRVDPTGEAIPGAMGRVVAGGPGFVAVGVDGSGGDYDAAVWTSSGGYVWERVAHDEAIFGGAGDQVMQGLAAGGPGFVAVGFDESRGDPDAALWTSTDGLVWQRVTDIGGVFATGIAIGDDILVTVGMDIGADGTQIAAVWTSADGLSWTRIPHDDDVFGGDANQAMNAVAYGVAGFVAVGYEAEESGPGVLKPDFDAAVWVSSDGLSWSRVPHDESLFGGNDLQGIEAVHEGPSGVVALGYDALNGPYDVVVWTSTDGTDWARVPHDPDVLGGAGQQVVRHVAAGEVGLVAVGRDGAGGDADAAVWTSTDGTAWTQLNDETFGGAGDQEMRGVMVLDDRIIAVGTDRVTGEPTAVVWIGSPQVVDEPGPEVDAADPAPSESTPTAEDPTSDPAAAEAAALRHTERAAQFDALLAEQGLAGLALGDGEFVVVHEEVQTLATFDVPLEADALSGHVTFIEGLEGEQAADGRFGIEVHVDEVLVPVDGAAWVDGAIQAVIRMFEPDLSEAEITDLTAELAAGFHYEEVGSSAFTTAGSLTDLPMEIIGFPRP